jgi:hypothetical protein
VKVFSVRERIGLILISCGVLVGVIYFSGQLNRSELATPGGSSTAALLRPTYYGPLIPTRLADRPIQPSVMAVPAAKITPGAVKLTGSPADQLYTLRQRVCAGVPLPAVAAATLAQLKPGWYVNWSTALRPYRPDGIEFAQMVRVPKGRLQPDVKTIARIAQQNPGALWLIGNEMDVIWQDNATPHQYAAAYHAAYTALKQADPRSRVAIGGVSLPSSLRLQYLEQVLQAYRDKYRQEMPIDVWNVHNFVLPEQRGSWGVDIPPGSTAQGGLNYNIDDNGNLEVFKQQLVDFRRWLAQHGYRDKELIVSEYGILMYADYDFGYERVRDFMLGTFDFMRTAADPVLGLPADGNRLVQRWCWYSLADTVYPTGNLVDPGTRRLTPLGRDFQQYLKQ